MTAEAPSETFIFGLSVTAKTKLLFYLQNLGMIFHHVKTVIPGLHTK